MRRRIKWSHEKSRERLSERHASQKPAGVDTTHEIVAPEEMPEWLRKGTREVVDVAMTDEAPEEWVKFSSDATGFSDKSSRALWHEIPKRLADAGAGTVYGYARSRGVWAESFKYIDVLKNGEPVGWYDLDSGLVQYVTLHDLVFQPQPMVVDGRKLFLMTEKMWVDGTYPPEVGGRTTSKEPSGRIAVDARARAGRAARAAKR